MKKYSFSVILSLFLHFITTSIFANVDIHKFKPTSYVTDMGDLFEDEQELKLNEFISEINKNTKVEICVITLRSLEGDDIFNYAQEQFTRIGIGKKSSNNGILMVFSKEDRKWRIHTGTGMEAILPDITCNHIGNEIIKPSFKIGEYYDGVYKGINAIKNIVNKNPDDVKNFIDKEKIENTADIDFSLFFTVIAIMLLSGFIIYLIYKKVTEKWYESQQIFDTLQSKTNEIINYRNKINSQKDSKSTGVKFVDEIYQELVSLLKELDGFSKDFKLESPKLFDIQTQKFLIDNGTRRIESMSIVLSKLNKSYSKWIQQKEKFESIKTMVRDMNPEILENNLSKNLSTIQYLKNKYQVSIYYDEIKAKSLIAKTVELKTKIQSMYMHSQFDETYKQLTEYKNILNEFQSLSDKLESVSSRYKTAENNIKNWENILSNSKQSLRLYSKFAKQDESEEIDNVLRALKNYMSTYSTDKLLEFSDNFNNSINSISGMEKIWKKRMLDEAEAKRREEARIREEEAEERRKKQREEAAERARILAIAQANEESTRQYYTPSRSDDTPSSPSVDFSGGDTGGGGSDGTW